MKYTRILLFLSPMLLFVPPLISVDSSVGLELLDGFYKGMLGRFPGNAIMAFLCYSYATQIGREGWVWVVGSLVLPFLAPLILAFMPVKYGSPAEVERRGNGRAAPAMAAIGPFETRFPLLGAYLAPLPPSAAVEARERLDPVPANFEFSVLVEPAGLDPLVAGATARQLSVWSRVEDAGVRVFGAGMLTPSAVADVSAWLRNAAPSRKVATAVHQSEGRPTKFFEYYPNAS